MTVVDEMLAQELADTIEAAHRSWGYRPVSERDQRGERKAGTSSGSAPSHRASRSETRLARDLVGTPSPPKFGVCRYCGGPAPRRTTCHAHSDLPQIDPTTGVETTTATTGRKHAA